MTLATFSTSKEAQQAAALLNGYHFELGNHDAPQWVALWLDFYRPEWIRDAVIEALYQGRYKAFSVRQILELWQRRGKPIRHTTHDFESAVCQAYGGPLLKHPITTKAATAKQTKPAQPARQRASLRTHKSLSAISFNLSEQPPFQLSDRQLTNALIEESPDKMLDTVLKGKTNHQTDTASELNQNQQGQTPFIPENGNMQSSRRVLIETAETLQAHHQANGVRYSPGRAIQPFKPALPFSAQTLRLAKQKALALSESR